MSTEFIDEIREQFCNVKLEDGVSLNMTEFNDSSGMATAYATLAVKDERDDRQRISDDVLEQFTVTFSFTDRKGFRFYLPAYMSYALRNPVRTSVIANMAIDALVPDWFDCLDKRPVTKDQTI